MFPERLTKQVICSEDYPIVHTRYGAVRGMEREGIFTFKGIPYAQARRFHMPEPPASWEGVRNALAYAHVCPEPNPQISPGQHICPNVFYPSSEHCHYLNIWTPGISDNGTRPVIVWIHGGGWHNGSSIEQYAYDGENLSRFGDAVIVSLNHRLNCLGYLDLSALSEEYKHSDLVGLVDLVHALRWVQENISAFGGDPANVTVMGQSGGGSKIAALMNMPMADGLYHKVILQSGGERCASAPKGQDLKQIRQQIGLHTALLLGLSEQNIQEIEEVPYHALAQAATKAVALMEQTLGKGTWGRWEPMGDGEIFLGFPHLVGFRKEVAHIPMLTCSVYGEQQANIFVRKNKWTPDQAASQLQKAFGEKTEQVNALFAEAYPDKKPQDVMFMDTLTRPGMLKLGASFQRSGGKVWNALFALESPMLDGITPWHCAEIPFTFHNACHLDAFYIPGVTEQVEDRMAGAWVHFARAGTPGTPELPEWPPLTEGHFPTMVFDWTIRLGLDHDTELLRLIGRVAF